VTDDTDTGLGGGQPEPSLQDLNDWAAEKKRLERMRMPPPVESDTKGMHESLALFIGGLRARLRRLSRSA